MCGIAGVINPADNLQAVTEIKEVAGNLLHRGPDQDGFFISDQVLLAHRRLSIIDLSNGRQPLFNEDKSVVVVFNGEIYNYRELREELIGKGHVFQTSSDTEVLVHLYEEHGREMAKQLNGMFAFAIYDQKKGKVLLFRDRAGQKPLIYAVQNKSLFFASELGAMKRFRSMEWSLNVEAINLFFSFQYIPAPNTVYNSVYKLMPGQLLEFDINTAEYKLHSYWKLDMSKKRHIPLAQAANEFNELLTDAVKRRMIADVPLGVFLSGGIDSTIIGGIMAKLSKNAVQSFSIGFEEAAYDERSYAALAAKSINQKSNDGLDYHEKIVSCGDFSLLESLLTNCGEPFADASIMPTAMLCDFARHSVSVALSGDAADELFGGYDRYLVMKYIHNFDLMPNSLRKTLFKNFQKLLPDGGERSRSGRLRRLLGVIAAPDNEHYFQLLNRTSGDLRKRLFGEMMLHCGDDGNNYLSELFAQATTQDELERTLEVDFNSYLYNDVLTKVDIASMHASLEVRNPFLDFRVIEYAASLPLELKISGRDKKHFLKFACRDLLPPEIANRRKSGFGVPLASYFRDKWRTQCENYLSDSCAAAGGFLNQSEIDRIWQIHQSGKLDLSYLIWNILIFEIFMRKENLL